MFLGCLFVEAPSAKLALRELVLLRLLQDLLLLLSRLVIVAPCLFDTASQLQGLCLPLWNLLFCLLLLHLFLNHLSLLHEFLLLIGYQSLVLRVEFLPLLLENLTADIFMLGNAIRVKSSTASLTALDILRGIVLSDLYPILTVNLLDTFLLDRIALLRRLPHLLLLLLLHLPLRFLITTLLLIIVLLILLRISFLLIIIILVGGFGLLVHILVGVGVIGVSSIALSGLRVIIRILILVTSNIYMRGVVLLVLACCRDGAFEEYEPP